MKKKLLFLFPLLVLLILLIAPTNIHINGSKTIEVEVGSEYIDEGASLRIGKGIKTKGSVDTSKLGTYKVSYSWFLQKATRKVKVVDLTAPTIQLEGNLEIDLIQDSKYVEAGYQTNDNYDKDVEVKVSKLNTSKLGTVELTYQAIDQSGNKATATRIIHIVEDDYHYLRYLENPIGLTDAMIQPIINFYDQFFRSMRYLNSYSDPSIYSNEKAAMTSDYAFNYLIETRKQSINDLYLNDCSYDIHIQSIQMNDGIVSIQILVDENCNFNFMYETTSKIYGIEDTFNLVEVNGTYQIDSINKGEGYYSLFTSSNTNLEDTYQQALSLMQQSITSYETDRQEANNGFTYNETANIPYNREAAVEYAYTYWHTRNDAYSHYESNCMNLGSQCMYAGGIDMDYHGNANTYQQWKNYSSNLNPNEQPNGLVYTWTYIPFFREYLTNDTDHHIVSIINANLYTAEGGDMVQISNTDLNAPVHNMVVVENKKNAKGEVVDIIVCGNTLDMENWPLSASAYPYKSLVKIFGAN